MLTASLFLVVSISLPLFAVLAFFLLSEKSNGLSDLGIASIVFALIISAVLLVYGTGGLLQSAKCGKIGDGLGKESRWSYFTNCQIEHEGRWIPLDKYRIQE